jgi:1-acyl-sn-glycerol-3-phosphate acyltransferase
MAQMIQLRSALFHIWLVVATALVALLFAPALVFGEKPARAATRCWARTVLFGLRVICGVRHRIEGAEDIPKGGAIVALNHQSMWETVAVFALLKKPSVVFKKELKRVPVYGWWTTLAGCIPVDREAGARAIRELARAAAEKVRGGAQVVLFPEGTRAPVGEERPLQPGVAAVYAAANAPCVPGGHDSGRFWKHPGWRKTPGTIVLRFAPPIPPGLPRKEFQRLLAERIAQARPDLEATRAAPEAAE